MTSTKYIHPLFAAVLFLLFQVHHPATAQQPAMISYSPSAADFVNPERGFMRFTETTSGDYTPLSPNELASWRNLHLPGGDPAADYAIFASLVYRGFYLESFTNSPISTAYLTAMQEDFNAARLAGVKLIVRFAYTKETTPPYGDAPKLIVLQHIAQLKPLLLANSDVIATLQMGFIGAWGEGYYTDHFGFGSLSAQNWADRTDVLNALLDALPANRSVSVRYPQMKQKAVYGPQAPASAAPLTLAEAWQNTPKARIGFVNDCFLSDPSDTGTYTNYDLNASGCDTCLFKPYFAVDSRYVPVGGETCNDWNPYSDCTGPSGGNAQTEMARMHFSYLNSGWYNAVNNDWVSGGCIEEIKQRLGYRFELQTGEFTAESQPGQTVSVKIELKNKGFAAPYNPRQVRLLLRHTTTGALWHVDLTDDPRTWFAGDETHTIEQAFCLPPDLPFGNYALLLHLPDPEPALVDRPEYAIQLANQNVWEPATGFNSLLHQIVVNSGANQTACAGETCFQPAMLSLPTADFMASSQNGCAPFTVTYSSEDSPCLDHQWSFPGGTPATSTEANPTVVYQTPGTFSVSLTTTNAAGSGTQTKNNFIGVEQEPIVSILPWTDIQICEGQTATLAVSGINLVNFQWYFNAMPIPEATTTFLIAITPGIYRVFAANAAGCGSFSSEIFLDVVPDPLLSITGLDTAYTDQDPPVTLVASTPGGTFSGPGVSGNQFFPALAGVGQHQISYQLTDSNGCTFKAFFTVTVSPFVSTTLPEGFSSIQLFPNPTSGDFYLKIDLTASKNLTINLLDSNGRVLERRAADFLAGESVLLFEKWELASGAYVLEVADEQGNAFRQRVVLVK